MAWGERRKKLSWALTAQQLLTSKQCSAIGYFFIHIACDRQNIFTKFMITVETPKPKS